MDASVIGDLAQLITALAAFGTFVMMWKASRKIEGIEHNTNSMSKALNEAKEEAAELKGKQDERAAGDARSAAEARGREEVRSAKTEKVVDEAINGPTEAQAQAAADTAEAAVETVKAASDTVDAASGAVDALKRKT